MDIDPEVGQRGGWVGGGQSAKMLPIFVDYVHL